MDVLTNLSILLFRKVVQKLHLFHSIKKSFSNVNVSKPGYDPDIQTGQNQGNIHSLARVKIVQAAVPLRSFSAQVYPFIVFRRYSMRRNPLSFALEIAHCWHPLCLN